MIWNHDINQAPKGEISVKLTNQLDKDGNRVSRKYTIPAYILAVTSDRSVIKSYYWIDTKGDGHWSGFTDKSPPIAWAPWPEYTGGA